MKAAFSAHKLERHRLKPLNDHVIVSDMTFDERISRGGLILPNDNGTSRGIRPRWGQIYAVGPDQKEFAIGQWVLVAHGRWTRGIDVEDETGKKTLRRIDPNDILMISDEEVHDETFSAAIHVDKKPDHMLHG